MPSAAIESSTDEPRKYVEPHERKKGPWEDYELSDAARHIERAEKVKANPAFAEAVVKHVDKKAKDHAKTARSMRQHLKRGLVSDRAMEKARAKHGA